MTTKEMVEQSSRKGLRGRLSLPTKEAPTPEFAQPASIELPKDSDEPMQDQRFERSLYEARNRWDIDRRRSGHHVGERKISKDEAGRLLRLALQAMEVPS